MNLFVNNDEEIAAEFLKRICNFTSDKSLAHVLFE